MTTPSSPSHNRTLRVADLLDRPGVSRRIALALDAPDDLPLDLAQLEGPVRLDGVVESVVEGILVRGDLSADLRMPCARCLADLDLTVTADVVELFVDPTKPGTEGEVDAGYEIRDGELDLDTLVRDALLPSVPYRPLCDEACAGLCPTCGTDLNQGPCNCVDEHVDARWAALAELRLDDGDQGPDTDQEPVHQLVATEEKSDEV